MSEPEGKLTFGLNYRPSEARHRNGCWFMVEEVLCSREGDCWRMRVWGPLPGDPGRRGDSS